MSTYEPLHHKYRPQTFADLVGQEAIATTLTNAIKTERIAPAYLLTGARGTGKTSTARIIAKSLNCIRYDAPTPTPCGTCSMCREITTGRSLDITEIDAASNTGVDNIREIIERAQFAPVQARYKVYAIDECHMLSTAAFNALLKTLEEPPNRVVFILATTDPQRVLPTIISRCQRFDFRRIPLDDIVSHLGKIAQNEKIEINPEALLLVAQISQGGLRDAESLLDQLSLIEGEITPEAVWDLVGSVPERDLLSLLEAIAADSPTQIIDFVRQIMDRGREPLIVLQSLAGSYRDLLIAKTASDRNDLVALTPPSWEHLKQLAQALSLPAILEGQKHLRSAEVQIKNSTQPRLWLEVTLMGLLPSAISPPSQTYPPANSQVNFQAITVPATPIHSKSQLPPAVPTASAVVTPADPPTPVIPTRSPAPDPTPIQTTEAIEHTQVEQIPAPPLPEPIAEKSFTREEVAPKAEPQAQEPPVSVFALDLETSWAQILGHLELISRVAKEVLAQQGKLLEVNQAIVKVGITRNNIRHVKPKMHEVEQCCRKVFGNSVKLEIEAIDSLSTANVVGSPTALTPVQFTAPTAKVSVQETAQPPLRHAPAFPNPSPTQYQAPSSQVSPTSDRAPTYAQSLAQPQVGISSSTLTVPSVNQATIPAASNTAPTSNSPETSTISPAKNMFISPSDEDIAIRRIADIFNGQIISLEEEEDVEE
ncbi:DNA polymerase III subunit gamma/tau [Tumidithrix helvetica PCC 7403]